jgi:hypothetical protein
MSIYKTVNGKLVLVSGPGLAPFINANPAFIKQANRGRRSGYKHLPPRLRPVRISLKCTRVIT